MALLARLGRYAVCGFNTFDTSLEILAEYEGKIFLAELKGGDTDTVPLAKSAIERKQTVPESIH